MATSRPSLIVESRPTLGPSCPGLRRRFWPRPSRVGARRRPRRDRHTPRWPPRRRRRWRSRRDDRRSAASGGAMSSSRAWPRTRAACRVEWVDRTRQWVHTTVIDEATGRPVPCRIHFRSPQGVPWQPHGHHAHVNADLARWGMDVGGDMRLGAVVVRPIDGRCGLAPAKAKCSSRLSAASSTSRSESASESSPVSVSSADGSGDGRYAPRGWFSGDTHVHFLVRRWRSPRGRGRGPARREPAPAQWGRLFTNTEDFTGRPSCRSDGETIVHVGQENRQHALGHLGLLGLREPVMPWSSDGPRRPSSGRALETTLSHWADAGHAQGGLVAIPHFTLPNGERPRSSPPDAAMRSR